MGSFEDDTYIEAVPDDVDKSQEEWDELSYHTQYYHANEDRQERMRKSARKRINKKKDNVNQIKEDEGCTYCGEDEAACLDFHHVNEDGTWVSNLVNDDASWDKIECEIDKCEVVCANCHRKIHAGLI